MQPIWNLNRLPRTCPKPPEWDGPARSSLVIWALGSWTPLPPDPWPRSGSVPPTGRGWLYGECPTLRQNCWASWLRIPRKCSLWLIGGLMNVYLKVQTNWPGSHLSWFMKSVGGFHREGKTFVTVNGGDWIITTEMQIWGLPGNLNIGISVMD